MISYNNNLNTYDIMNNATNYLKQFGIWKSDSSPNDKISSSSLTLAELVRTKPQTIPSVRDVALTASHFISPSLCSSELVRYSIPATSESSEYQIKFCERSGEVDNSDKSDSLTELVRTNRPTFPSSASKMRYESNENQINPCERKQCSSFSLITMPIDRQICKDEVPDTHYHEETSVKSHFSLREYKTLDPKILEGRFQALIIGCKNYDIDMVKWCLESCRFTSDQIKILITTANRDLNNFSSLILLIIEHGYDFEISDIKEIFFNDHVFVNKLLDYMFEFIIFSDKDVQTVSSFAAHLSYSSQRDVSRVKPDTLEELVRTKSQTLPSVKDLALDASHFRHLGHKSLRELFPLLLEHSDYQNEADRMLVYVLMHLKAIYPENYDDLAYYEIAKKIIPLIDLHSPIIYHELDSYHDMEPSIVRLLIEHGFIIDDKRQLDILNKKNRTSALNIIAKYIRLK